MFGLEGSGFVISISLTFLLIGLVVYLFKKQLFTLEKKFSTIFELSQSLATSVENLKSNKSTPEAASNVDDKPHVTETTTVVQDSSEPANLAQESSESMLSNNFNPLCPFSTIKIIDINENAETNILENMLQINNKNTTEITECSSDESDTTESDSDSDNDSESDNDNENKTEVSNEAPLVEVQNTKELPLVESSARKDNLNQLKVNELRDLVIKNEIKTDKEVRSMKKSELIELLKKNN